MKIMMIIETKVGIAGTSKCLEKCIIWFVIKKRSSKRDLRFKIGVGNRFSK